MADDPAARSSNLVGRTSCTSMLCFRAILGLGLLLATNPLLKSSPLSADKTSANAQSNRVAAADSPVVVESLPSADQQYRRYISELERVNQALPGYYHGIYSSDSNSSH